jgi:hypothetical protein
MSETLRHDRAPGIEWLRAFYDDEHQEREFRFDFGFRTEPYAVYLRELFFGPDYQVDNSDDANEYVQGFALVGKTATAVTVRAPVGFHGVVNCLAVSDEVGKRHREKLARAEWWNGDYHDKVDVRPLETKAVS